MGSLIPAVYAIICLIDQCRYIGSTTRPDKRPDEHWRALSSGKHFNRGLQRAYDEHGANNFVFVVLNWTIDAAALPELEREFLKSAMAAGRAYNRSLQTKASRGHILTEQTRQRQAAAKIGKKRPGFGEKIGPILAKTYRFVAPSGKIVETHGLRALAEEHGLSVGNLHSVHSGRLRHTKGWRRAD